MMNCNMVLILLMNINNINFVVKLTKCLVGENVNLCQFFGQKACEMAFKSQIR
jgi:hypothetical protein